MRNIYANAGGIIKIVPYEKMGNEIEYQKNLIENVIDETLDIFEEGLNNNEFLAFNFDGCDR